MTADRLERLLEVRLRRPRAIAEAAEARTRAAPDPGPGPGRHLLIAADHPARGALAAGGSPMAMADRLDLLDRLCTALARPGVTGVLGTADILEDLLLLGALEGKVVFGSMNRGGLADTVFEIDDRFTGYDPETLAAMRFDGGKMLFRIDPGDPGSVRTMEACARAVTALARRGLTAMVEPFISRRVDGRIRNDLRAEAVIRSVAVASGLGATSAYTWLKLPVVPGDDEMARVLAASTLPVLLLGGEVPEDPEATYARWGKALRAPTVRGLIVGRSLLFPADGDVAGAVDAAANLLEDRR
ncbi:MAG: aldolase [Streptosporangiales bacterium]|nr:aldolase [Streptosporangiales bacterium]